MQAAFRTRLAEFDARQRDAHKPYLQRLEDDVLLNDDDVLSDAILHRSVLTMAAHYFGHIPRFVSRDVWNTLPATSFERIASQHWHRDYNDLQMLKVFIYLNDVDSQNGPFEYVRGSHYRGPLGRVLYRAVSANGTRRYPTDAELRPFEHRLADAAVSCVGPAGTVILVDTFGLHRGGFVRRGTREVVMALFASQANLHPSNFRVSASAALLADPLRRAACGMD